MSRLAELLADAACGRFPPIDGVVEVVGPDAPHGIQVIAEFTGHAVIATSRAPEEVSSRVSDAYGGVTHPEFQRWLAGPDGVIGCHDALLVARGTGGGGLPARPDLAAHPRVQHARERRESVVVHGDERGLVTLARGVAGRLEISVELAHSADGSRGLGRSLIRDGLAVAPAEAPVFASVSPGNAASMRAFLAVGFEVIGAEILVHPPRSSEPVSEVAAVRPRR